MTFVNDPCDEWPRGPLLNVALGYRACGHVPSPGICNACMEEAWESRVLMGRSADTTFNVGGHAIRIPPKPVCP